MVSGGTQVTPKPIRTPNTRETYTWTPALPYILISSIHPSIHPSIFLLLGPVQASATYLNTHNFTNSSFLSFIIHPLAHHPPSHPTTKLSPHLKSPIHPISLIFSFSHPSILPSIIPSSLSTYSSICPTIQRSSHSSIHSSKTNCMRYFSPLNHKHSSMILNLKTPL